MLSNLKSFYSKSVDLIKQVQDQVQPKQVSATATAPPSVAAVKLHPGQELISRQDKVWEAIATNGANLAVAVAGQDNKLKSVTERCEAELAAWKSLQGELTSMSTIVDSIDSLRAEMEALCGQLEHLDVALDGHMQAKEHKDMVQWKREIIRNTETFQASRQKDLINFEKALKTEHNKRLRQKAEEEARALREAELAKKREAKAKADEEARKAKEAQLLAKKQKEEEAKQASAASEKQGAATNETSVPSSDTAASSSPEAQPVSQTKDGDAAEAASEATPATEAEAAISKGDGTKPEEDSVKESSAVMGTEEATGEELEVDESVMNALEEKEKDS